jgi:glycosyltransferase involved in cell wall biosynthesis
MSKAVDTVTGQPTRVLVLASTFPVSATDPVPGFVRDQIIAMSERYPALSFSVLAPHDERSATVDHSSHEHYEEYRFHYFWPRSAEKLAGRGIMPALRENKLLYFAVPFLFLGEYFATVRLVKRLKPEIYAHWFTPQALVASWVSRRTNVPFVFTTHASDVDVWRRIPVVGSRIVRSATRAARAVTAVSSRSRDKLTRFFGESSVGVPLEIIPMGVPVPDVSVTADDKAAERAVLGLTADTVYLFIGRLVEKKGVPYLLEALSTIRDEIGSWQLVIAGDGPLLAETKAKVESLGLADNVRFTGFISGDEKHAYFRAADVMVVPSIVSSDGDAEGLPVALLEGLAYGLECIATNESGADDIITHGLDGLLCEEKDSAALATNLTYLHGLAANERRELSEQARALASRFAWSTIAERHYEFLFSPVLEATKEYASE